MSIVVVDDEAEVRGVIRDILEVVGYEVESFGEPLPVIAFSEHSSPPDLFLIDLMLPEMTGIELAQCLHERGLHSTPKIALSASRECIHAARASGYFVADVSKPFDLTDLLDTVERFLSSHR